MKDHFFFVEGMRAHWHTEIFTSIYVAILSCVFSVQFLLLNEGTTKKLALTKTINATWICLYVCIHVLCEVLYDFITCVGNSQHLELSHYRKSLCFPFKWPHLLPLHPTPTLSNHDSCLHFCDFIISRVLWNQMLCDIYWLTLFSSFSCYLSNLYIQIVCYFSLMEGMSVIPSERMYWSLGLV